MAIPVDILRMERPQARVLTIVPHDSFQLPVTLRNSATGLPYPLTGCTARLQIRAELTSTTPAVDKNPIPIDETAAGGYHFLIDLSPTDTAAIPIPSGMETKASFGACYWDVEINDGTNRKTIMGGTLTIQNEVTR